MPKITPTQQLNTVTSVLNPGNAGGGYSYINLGGMKILYGTTDNIQASPNSDVNRSINFPSGFFSSRPSFIFNIDQAAGSVTNNFAIGNTVTSTSAQIYWRNSTAATGVGGYVSYIAIGV